MPTPPDDEVLFLWTEAYFMGQLIVWDEVSTGVRMLVD
jgi:hypothetical protein